MGFAQCFPVASPRLILLNSPPGLPDVPFICTESILRPHPSMVYTQPSILARLLAGEVLELSSA
jgi:hypothetical protein